jgi:hypothetical protein
MSDENVAVFFIPVGVFEEYMLKKLQKIYIPLEKEGDFLETHITIELMNLYYKEFYLDFIESESFENIEHITIAVDLNENILLNPNILRESKFSENFDIFEIEIPIDGVNEKCYLVSVKEYEIENLILSGEEVLMNLDGYEISFTIDILKKALSEVGDNTFKTFVVRKSKEEKSLYVYGLLTGADIDNGGSFGLETLN